MTLLVIGAGIFLIGLSVRTEPLVKAQGGVIPVDAGALNPLDIQANNSPALGRNPKNPANLAVANRVDTPAFSCALNVSLNGGAKWRKTPIPLPPGEEQKCSSPDLAFDQAGVLYVSFLTLKGDGNVPDGIWTASSSDGGRTFSSPDRAFGPQGFAPRLAADPLERGRLYLTWVQVAEVGPFGFVNSDNPVNIARSDDGGLSWQGPVQVSPPSRQRSLAPSIAVGPRGELYLLYLDLKGDSLDYNATHVGKGGRPYSGAWALVMARSVDLGATWKESIVKTRLRPLSRFLAFFPPSPSVAAAPTSGTVYAAFHDSSGGDADSFVWTSKNMGATFRQGVRINDTVDGDGTSQYLPKLQVAPNGRLDALYFDRRSDANNRMNEVSFQSSFDEGKTFTPRLRLTDRAFDSQIGFGSERQMPDLGSRLGLVSENGGALAVWPDTRAGTQASNKQDLALAAVSVRPPQQFSFLSLPLRLLGIALALGGAAMMLFQFIPASRRHGGRA